MLGRQPAHLRHRKGVERGRAVTKGWDLFSATSAARGTNWYALRVDLRQARLLLGAGLRGLGLDPDPAVIVWLANGSGPRLRDFEQGLSEISRLTAPARLFGDNTDFARQGYGRPGRAFPALQSARQDDCRASPYRAATLDFYGSVTCRSGSMERICAALVFMSVLSAGACKLVCKACQICYLIVSPIQPLRSDRHRHGIAQHENCPIRDFTNEF